MAETLAQGGGIWRSCTGCHALNEGHATGPYSALLKCHLGGGCSECGGIGAVCDTTDYQAMADDMARSMGQTAAPQVGEDARPVALKEHGAWDGLEALDDLPDGTELYAAPRPVTRIVAYRLLDSDGASESEWFDGSPAGKSAHQAAKQAAHHREQS